MIRKKPPNTQDLLPPSDGQVKRIARLSAILHITEPRHHFESMGEAGRYIRELEAEYAYRKKGGKKNG